LFVDERTLLPVLQPFAPASRVIGRFPNALEQVLTAHGRPADFISSEIAEMALRCEPSEKWWSGTSAKLCLRSASTR